MTGAWRCERRDAIPVLLAALVPAVFARAVLVDTVPWWWLPVIAIVGVGVGLAIVTLVPVDRDIAVASPRDEHPEPVMERAAAPGPVMEAPTLVPPGGVAAPVEPPPPPAIVPQEPVRRNGSWTLLESPKVGNDPSMNEDAVAVSDDGRTVAVADGASSAYASGLWARLLVDDIVEHRLDLGRADSRAELLGRCSQRWLQATDAAASWWADEARSRGSFAAVAAVTLLDDGRWRAVAKGDCCVIVLDAERRIATSFPIEHSADFGLTPDLVGVRDDGATDARAEGWHTAEGTLPPDGVLMLASDGFAQWLLDDRARADRWLATDPDGWLPLLDELRDSGEMVNDDVAVATTTVGEALR